MSSPKRLQIPHVITEFDDNILVPLNKNFGEIQIKVAETQRRVEVLETLVNEIIEVLAGST